MVFVARPALRSRSFADLVARCGGCSGHLARRAESGAQTRGGQTHERVAALAARLVRGYQLVLRPLLPAACRFEPSCSEYARQACCTTGCLRGGGWESGGSPGAIRGIRADTILHRRRRLIRRTTGRLMDKRAILAAMLMAGLLMVYQAVRHAGAPTPEQRRPEDGGARAHAGPRDARAGPRRARRPTAASREGCAGVPERTAIVETPLYRAAIAATAAQIRRGTSTIGARSPGRARPARARGLRGASDRAAGAAVAFALSAESIKLAKDDADGRAAHDRRGRLRPPGDRDARASAPTATWSSRDQVENRHASRRAPSSSWRGGPPWSGRRTAEQFPGAASDPRRAARGGHRAGAARTCASATEYSGDGRWVGSRAAGRAVVPDRAHPEERRACSSSERKASETRARSQSRRFVRDRGPDDPAGARARAGMGRAGH